MSKCLTSIQKLIDMQKKENLLHDQKKYESVWVIFLRVGFIVFGNNYGQFSLMWKLTD